MNTRDYQPADGFSLYPPPPPPGKGRIFKGLGPKSLRTRDHILPAAQSPAAPLQQHKPS